VRFLTPLYLSAPYTSGIVQQDAQIKQAEVKRRPAPGSGSEIKRLVPGKKKKKKSPVVQE
jgi:hypothetical protein